MSDADRLHELLGLPAVEFQREAEEATRPPAGAVAWRVSVDPYDGDVAWEAEFEAFLEAVDPSGVEALIIGQWGSRTRRPRPTPSVSSSPRPTG